MLDLDAFLGIAGCDSSVYIVELVDGEIRIQLVRLLKLLEMLEVINARRIRLERTRNGRDLLCLVALAKKK